MGGIAKGGDVATGVILVYFCVFLDFFWGVRGGGGRGEEIRDPRACSAGTDGGNDTLCLVLVGVASRQGRKG